MHLLRQMAKFAPKSKAICGLRSTVPKPHLNSFTFFKSLSGKSTKNGDDEWNDAWETAWLPEDLSGKEARAPWEMDVHFPSADPTEAADVDAETKAFVEDMNENWNERRKVTARTLKLETEKKDDKGGGEIGGSLYSLENMKKDYRLKKQRIHAGLWMKEIEKQQEANLMDSGLGVADDIDRLLDSYSEIFDTANNELDDSKISSSSDLKNKPDGWETTSKGQDGNIWEMSQREEDILIQEFDRRIAYCKFQIASFIKTHIFSRRRPIDGWKYMIEEIGPNARKGKGSVSRIPSLVDASTQPFREERMPLGSNLTPLKEREAFVLKKLFPLSCLYFVYVDLLGDDVNSTGNRSYSTIMPCNECGIAPKMPFGFTFIFTPTLRIHFSQSERQLWTTQDPLLKLH